MKRVVLSLGIERNAWWCWVCDHGALFTFTTLLAHSVDDSRDCLVPEPIFNTQLLFNIGHTSHMASVADWDKTSITHDGSINNAILIATVYSTMQFTLCRISITLSIRCKTKQYYPKYYIKQTKQSHSRVDVCYPFLQRSAVIIVQLILFVLSVLRSKRFKLLYLFYKSKIWIAVCTMNRSVRNKQIAYFRV